MAIRSDTQIIEACASGAISKVMEKRKQFLYERKEGYIGNICTRFAKAFTRLFEEYFEISAKELQDFSDDEFKELSDVMYHRARKVSLFTRSLMALVPVVGWLAATSLPNKNCAGASYKIEYVYCYKFLRKGLGDNFFPLEHLRKRIAEISSSNSN